MSGPYPEHLAVQNSKQKIWVNNILFQTYENNAIVAEKVLIVI
jgi:hypothetical protein